LQTWEAEHGALPDTLKARSPSGSIHRFFKHPGTGIKIKNVAGIMHGVDVRGNGGMVIGVPSYRPPNPATADAPAKAGGVYVWVNQGHRIVDAPEALLELVMEKPAAPQEPINKKAQDFERQGQTSSRKNSRRNRSWAETALDDECDKLASTSKGERNDQLNRSAFSLGQIVGGGSLSEDEVIEALMQAAETNGSLKDKGKTVCTKTIKSGLSKGKLTPRYPPETPPKDTADSNPEADAIGKAKAAKQAKKKKVVGVTINDFYALMPMHSYIFVPSREMWPASSQHADSVAAGVQEKRQA
jgi:putative DNA primase/helicase